MIYSIFIDFLVLDYPYIYGINFALALEMIFFSVQSPTHNIFYKVGF